MIRRIKKLLDSAFRSAIKSADVIFSVILASNTEIKEIKKDIKSLKHHNGAIEDPKIAVLYDKVNSEITSGKASGKVSSRYDLPK